MVDGQAHRAGTRWRAFVSHTSELREFPRGRSYVAAVERAVTACGHVIVDMADFPAADLPSARLCTDRVASCDVYIGVVSGKLGAGSQYPLQLAAALAMTLPVAIIFFVFQKYIMRTGEGAIKE